jgi:hypothetical protein
MLREESDDISTLTGTVPQQVQTNANNQNKKQNGNSNANISGVTWSINQVSLDNASQAFSCRRLNVCRSRQRISRPNREISSIKQSSEFLNIEWS